MDLLNNLTEDSNTEVIDLLADLGEDDAPAWMPKASGEGVQGTVVSIGSIKSKYPDAATGQFPDCPVITLRQTDSSEIRVTAYQSILRKEIQDAGVQVGDLFAAKYFGLKDNKAGSGSYHHYKVAVRPAPRTAAPRPF